MTRVNKSDPHDAEGFAQLSRTGWFKAVRIKQEATHLDRAQLKIREQLIRAHRSMANQLRGPLKLFGLRMGKVPTPGKRAERLAALFAQKPELKAVMLPLIEASMRSTYRSGDRPGCSPPVPPPIRSRRG